MGLVRGRKQQDVKGQVDSGAFVFAREEDVTVIAGDPVHNLLAFRRVVPPRANNASELPRRELRDFQSDAVSK